MSTPVSDRVTRIVREHLGIDDDVVLVAEMRFDGVELDADSLDVIDLTLAVEEEFAIEVPVEDIDELSTLGDLIAYAEKKVLAKAHR